MVVHVNEHVHDYAESTCTDEGPEEDRRFVHVELWKEVG